ncbi:MAG: FAD-binding oxidoreductase [Parvibaculaceae bacterium]|nr:FAD-binding oxidoreductase [Parvibaculaceae bacterium]
MKRPSPQSAKADGDTQASALNTGNSSALDRLKLRWNGWGATDHPNPLPDGAPQWSLLRDVLGLTTLPATPAKKLIDCILPINQLPAAAKHGLEEIVGADNVHVSDFERAFHARGQSYHDLLHLRAGELGLAPDAIVYPQSSAQVERVLTLCAERNVAVVPFGGGSSVVGGVNAHAKSVGGPVITLDMTAMNNILKIDKHAMTATIEAGIYGPDLEHQLAKHGVTLSHFPQSFQFSTLGGWIAARGAGQQSNRYGKAEKWFVGAKLVTPQGSWDTETFPASAAGPNLAQLLCGSEGTLGVICEATVKIHEIPKAKDYRGYLFPDFETGLALARQINHADIPIAMLRLSDPDETGYFQAFSASSAFGLKAYLQKLYLRWKRMGDAPCLMLIGLEGDPSTVAWARAQTSTLCRKAGALSLGTGPGKKWYHSRFDSPFARDPMLDRGIGVDTLETATSWPQLLNLQNKVREAILQAIASDPSEETSQGLKGICMSHLSHSYPDGASLYFTFLFPRDLENEVAQWQKIKRAASDAIIAHGGTISHHHGVGTDHTPWLEEEKGAIGINLLRQIKSELDPKGIMNPEKLIR